MLIKKLSASFLAVSFAFSGVSAQASTADAQVGEFSALFFLNAGAAAILEEPELLGWGRIFAFAWADGERAFGSARSGFGSPNLYIRIGAFLGKVS